VKRLLLDSLDETLDDFEVLSILVLFVFFHYKYPGIIISNDLKRYLINSEQNKL